MVVWNSSTSVIKWRNPGSSLPAQELSPHSAAHLRKIPVDTCLAWPSSGAWNVLQVTPWSFVHVKIFIARNVIIGKNKQKMPIKLEQLIKYFKHLFK